VQLIALEKFHQYFKTLMDSPGRSQEFFQEGALITNVQMYAENAIKAIVRPDVNKVEHSRTNTNKRIHSQNEGIDNSSSKHLLQILLKSHKNLRLGHQNNNGFTM
jgi:negative regulator of genetic competence, sporulation and motility